MILWSFWSHVLTNYNSKQNNSSINYLFGPIIKYSNSVGWGVFEGLGTSYSQVYLQIK